MKTLVSKTGWVNWAGSAALVAMIALVTSAEASQDPQARIKGGMIQKGREPTVATIPAVSAVPSPEQAACDRGTATACRAIEAGMTRGDWTWLDGGISAMDDWESPVARQASPPPAPSQASGNHIPSAVLVQRVLAACDAGDVTACRAFAGSVVQKTDVRTYTGGRRTERP